MAGLPTAVVTVPSIYPSGAARSTKIPQTS
jgi:hypothetical protein